MANNELGEVRRSTSVMTFGPGAVVDFRADGAPVSAVPAGLEEWDANSSAKGLANPQQITEPRLQRKLSVGGFRLPPVVDRNINRAPLVAVRLPEWLQCPQCDRLSPADGWTRDPGRAYRYCSPCTNKAPGQRRVFAVPVRFVLACPKGHLDDFPWHYWVQHRGNCQKGRHTELYLKSERPGLSGLVLSCKKCKARRSMESVFSARTWRDEQCRGRRPWLAVDNERCEATPRVLQRGASNLYFPVTESALSIPPWSDALQEALGTNWNLIVSTNAKQRSTLIQILADGVLRQFLEELHLSQEELAQQVEERLARYNDDAILNIRQEEYRQFTMGYDTASEEREFEVRGVPMPLTLRPFFSRVVRVVRLREVRALKGFTRINPPGDDDSPDIASISYGHLDWLPAIEVRGEGVFLAFNQESLRAWEVRDHVIQRAQTIDRAWRRDWKQRYGDSEPTWRITPRHVLVHTFAHALMCQLTLECGYSTAALRERLYVSYDNDGMAGLLIYTATTDSDGTLGGLQRQGEPQRIARAVFAAVQAMEWCSADPLCIGRAIGGSDRLSLAACHACVLAPETACEEHNQFLDRALVVGLPGAPEVGFFSSIFKA